eukprot:388722-Prorocentrum_lima.AAC.1
MEQVLQMRSPPRTANGIISIEDFSKKSVWNIHFRRREQESIMDVFKEDSHDNQKEIRRKGAP